MSADILTMARKKRHIHLLDKLQKGKSLSSAELKELERFEGKPLPPGVVRTQAEVAKALSIATRTIERWVREGMSQTPEGYYNLIDIQAWRAVRSQKKTTKGKSKEYWEKRYREYKAKLANLELQEAIGQLISQKEVEKGQVARILAVKRALLALPKAVAPVLVGREAREIQVYLTDKVKEIIEQFAK